MNRRWLVVTLVVFVLAALARAALLFEHDMVPGMNGAYYLVQARSLMEKAALAIPDLPLVFVLHAGAAMVLGWFGLAEREAVLLAVKLGDSLLPALAVIPALALASSWAGRRVYSDIVLAAGLALLIPAGGIALGMVGDFQKNSFGVALLCGLVWALWRWAEHHDWRRGLLVLVLLGAIGLTHIAVFGTALIICAVVLMAQLLTSGSAQRRRVMLLALLAAPVAALCAGIVFWKFDPARVERLIGAFLDPGGFFGGGPMPGLPGMNRSLYWQPALGFALLALPAWMVAWKKRGETGAGKFAVITGMVIAVIAITGPWVQGDKMHRLQMNAAPLVLLCLMFALLQLQRGWLRVLMGVPVLALLMASAMMRWEAGARPIISEGTRAELQELAAWVEKPERTLVVTRHGLEWWTAWEWRSHIAQAKALKEEDWEKYDFVWFLEETRGGRGGPGGPGGLPPRMNGMPPGMGPRAEGSGPEWWRRALMSLANPGMGGPGGLGRPRNGPPGEGPPMFDGPGSRPPMMGGPPWMDGPPMPMAGGPPMRGGGGLMSAPMPPDAVLLHEGRSLRLGWVRDAPDFVRFAMAERQQGR